MVHRISCNRAKIREVLTDTYTVHVRFCVVIKQVNVKNNLHVKQSSFRSLESIFFFQFLFFSLTCTLEHMHMLTCTCTVHSSVLHILCLLTCA